MKIILLACKGKVEALLIKTAFFRGEMKKPSIGHSRCCGWWAPMRAALPTSRSIFRQLNVTKLLNSVHTLFTP